MYYLYLDESGDLGHPIQSKQYFYRQIAAVPFTVSAVILEIKLLQAVDFFAWGFFRKYETGDTRWYEVFREKIAFERVYPDK